MNCRRVYLDSNVFISLVREEINGAFNLRFRDSEAFFSLCKKEKIIVVLSDLFFKETERVVGLKREHVLEFLEKYKLEFVFIETSKDIKHKAKEIRNQNALHTTDALHTALALAAESRAVISWNKKDFEKVKSLIECETPLGFTQGFL